MRKARGKREGRETHKWLAHLTFYRSPGKRMSKPPIPQALRVFDPQAYESGPRRVSSLVQNLSENLSCRPTDFQILKALPNAFSSIFGLYFALSLSVNSFLESQPILWPYSICRLFVSSFCFGWIAQISTWKILDVMQRASPILVHYPRSRWIPPVDTFSSCYWISFIFRESSLGISLPKPPHCQTGSGRCFHFSVNQSKFLIGFMPCFCRNLRGLWPPNLFLTLPWKEFPQLRPFLVVNLAKPSWSLAP